METVDCTDENCSIVVQTHGSTMGIVVDKVSKVLDLAVKQTEEASACAIHRHARRFPGMDNVEGCAGLLQGIAKIISIRVMNIVRAAVVAASMRDV